MTVQSCKNQFYSDLVTPLPDKINVPGTEIHIFYALKMGEKYRERYERHFACLLYTSPGAVVINIACGLDTRCYRMAGYAHWYNLDLPETMAVREKLLPESGTISQIAMSAMDDWGGEISELSEQNVPVLIVIEGLTMYPVSYTHLSSSTYSRRCLLPHLPSGSMGRMGHMT